MDRTRKKSCGKGDEEDFVVNGLWVCAERVAVGDLIQCVSYLLCETKRLASNSISIYSVSRNALVPIQIDLSVTGYF